MAVLPLYSREPPAVDALLARAASLIDSKIASLDADLRQISHTISDNPELGFKEFKAHKLLTEYLASQPGFEVKGWPSLETAFVATFEHGTGGRTMGFNAEYDALPGIGHACGHNLIAIAGVAAALALADVLVQLNIPGRVKLLGTPAEEGGGGKVIMAREGAYDDMSACMMVHPEGGRDPADYPSRFQGGVGRMLAITGFEAEFHGKTAHAGANPWNGVNALDAAIEGYTAVSALRQQIPPDHRAHGVLKGTEGYAQNIIPDYAKVVYGCRAPTSAQVTALRKRVENCFRAAALSSGCTIDITTAGDYTYDDLHNNDVLAEEYVGFMTDHWGFEMDTANHSTASTDFGNVTYTLPACHPGFKIPAPTGSSNHTIGFTQAARTDAGQAAALKAAAGIANVGFKVLSDEAFAANARRAFDEWKRGD